jgi:pyrophosphatase PpaX
MYRTLLFDFDGTVVPSLELWLQAFHHAVHHYGRELPDQTIIDRFYYRDYADICEEFDLPSGPELRDTVHEGLAIAFEAATLYDGVLPLIDAARANGMRVGMVTTSPRPPVMQVLDAHGVADRFDTIVTGDDVTHCKPHPEPIHLALSRLGESHENALMIGDYLFDILAAKAAGVASALFLPERHARFYDFPKLLATGPDIVIGHYSELAKILNLPLSPTNAVLSGAIA